jgi:hypothetical protein
VFAGSCAWARARRRGCVFVAGGLVLTGSCSLAWVRVRGWRARARGRVWRAPARGLLLAAVGACSWLACSTGHALFLGVRAIPAGWRPGLPHPCAGVFVFTCRAVDAPRAVRPIPACSRPGLPRSCTRAVDARRAGALTNPAGWPPWLAAPRCWRARVSRVACRVSCGAVASRRTEFRFRFR